MAQSVAGKIYMLCQYDKLSQEREELVGGTHPKKMVKKNGA
jgi:hypothetical protein